MGRLHFLGARGILAALVLLGFITLPRAAQAQVSFNYSVAAAGPFTLGTDTVSLSAFTGSATLVSGIAQTLQIGTQNVTIGNNPDQAQTFNANRTINLTTFSLASSLSQNLSITIAAVADTVAVTGGTTTTFVLAGGSTINVTPIAASQDYVSLGAQAPTAINATFLFTSAPEPGTLALLALGIAGGVVARRRK